MRIGRPLQIGSLGGLLAAGAWFVASHLIRWPLPPIPLEDWERWLLVGCGFVYGMFGGAYLARKLAHLTAWMLATGLYTALVCELIHHLADAGVFVPQTPCDEESIRFAVVGAAIRLLPCLVVTIMLFGISWLMRDGIAGILLAGLGFLGLALLWALAGQEVKVHRLRRMVIRELRGPGTPKTDD